jgi:peptidoglycan/xylan/chitin deacetylase (PgdA/CDA1 family)
MEIVARRFSVVPLDDLVERLGTGAGAGGLAAVTFDDGYEDNCLCAFPILSRMGLPATIFLATDYVGHARPFWTDRLAAHLRRSIGAVVIVPDILGARIDLTSTERVRQSGCAPFFLESPAGWMLLSGEGPPTCRIRWTDRQD